MAVAERLSSSPQSLVTSISPIATVLIVLVQLQLMENFMPLWGLQSFEDFSESVTLHNHSSVTLFDEDDECVYDPDLLVEEGS